jgi:group II intron reverse transcriptase/maturase
MWPTLHFPGKLAPAKQTLKVVNYKPLDNDNERRTAMLNIKPKKIKAFSLTGRITPELMKKAWKAVKRNRGAAGVDRITTDKYEIDVEKRLDVLMNDLKTRNAYKTLPLKRVYIEKLDSDKLRPLGIPTVDARVAQEVIRQLINPIFEKQFHDDSFGFRAGRGCHQAIERVLKYMDEGYKMIADIDIKGFFDNIPHDVIMAMLRAEIADGNILDILEKFLSSGVMEDGKRSPTILGTPQGGVISPLLANIVLNYLDWQLAGQGYKFVRYADDIVILVKTKTEAENALDFTKKVLRDLGLETSPKKTRIVSASQGFQFLGFNIKGSSVTMRRKSIEKFERAIEDITTRSKNLDSNVITKLNQIIRGTVNYFSTKFSSVITYFTKIDQWIRMRIRSQKYKRKWHTDNRRLKNKHIVKIGLLSCRELCLLAKAR